MSTAAAGLVAGLIGLGAVAAVQTRANAGSDIGQRPAQRGQHTRARALQLALDAIKTFHTGVSEDLLLKERQFEKLRKSLLGRAVDFYAKLEDRLKGQADDRSQASLAVAYGELAS